MDRQTGISCFRFSLRKSRHAQRSCPLIYGGGSRSDGEIPSRCVTVIYILKFLSKILYQFIFVPIPHIPLSQNDCAVRSAHTDTPPNNNSALSLSLAFPADNFHTAQFGKRCAEFRRKIVQTSEAVPPSGTQGPDGLPDGQVRTKGGGGSPEELAIFIVDYSQK